MCMCMFIPSGARLANANGCAIQASWYGIFPSTPFGCPQQVEEGVFIRTRLRAIPRYIIILIKRITRRRGANSAHTHRHIIVYLCSSSV